MRKKCLICVFISKAFTIEYPLIESYTGFKDSVPRQNELALKLNDA